MAQQVVISRCRDYDQARIDEALRQGIDLLGGIGAFVRPGNKVVLKVNLLRPAKPEKGVTTHPAVVEAMVKMVQEAGGEPIIADSPGNTVPYTKSGLHLAYRGSGLLEVARRTGATLNWDTSFEEVSHPDGVLMKRLEIIRPILDADVVISMPKLKTHVFTLFTGATKNLFGCLPGLTKATYHARLHALPHFSAMLLDIISFVRPALVVMDGIVGMEGNGPSGGPTRPVGVLLLGRDSVAVDAVATSIVGIRPLEVQTLKLAYEWGWWSGRVADIETLGATIEEVRVPDFVQPPPNVRMEMSLGPPIVDRLVAPFIRRHLALWPAPNLELCTGCCTCVRSCPQEAIAIVDGGAVINYDDCIRCYCCHELCPEGAVELRRSLLGRIIYRDRKGG
jgi:uncharacterized protein (DUF362 family)/Pyruvate/2-oxoacid:ferredoxin oxidoreductase delta subunit